MAINIPQLGGSEGFDGDAIKGALEKKIVEGLGVDENLKNWANAEDPKDRDEFEAKLMQIRPKDWKEFITTEGQIKLEALRDKLTIKEKLSMLASHILGEQFFSIFFSGKKDNVTALGMEEATDYFARNPDKGARKMGKHLVWDQTLFGSLQPLFSLANLVNDKSGEGKEAFPLVPGTFWFMNMAVSEGGPKLMPTMYSVLRHACEQAGVKLTFLRPGEKPVEAPNLGEKEIKLSFLNPQSIPTKPDGTVDLELLDWYVECYDKAPCMIMRGGPLIAAILKRKGETVETAISTENANLGGQGMEPILNTIPKIGEPEIQKEALKPVELLPKTPDGKVDKAKLEEYRIADERNAATWLTPYQKAGVFVLQRCPVEQALAKAGIAATDPNYAKLKTDLESLAA
ncbi:MAG: hypothetical protein WC924_04275 [Candidatus Gracilibacteria bacterium]